jgi:hypothetical protein
MIKQGFIKKIGEPRSWNTKEGEQRCTYPVTVSIPYVRQDGRQGEDELVTDLTAGNPEYVENVKGLMAKGAECDLTIAFDVREYNGRLFNNVRLVNIAQRIN